MASIDLIKIKEDHNFTLEDMVEEMVKSIMVASNSWHDTGFRLTHQGTTYLLDIETKHSNKVPSNILAPRLKVHWNKVAEDASITRQELVKQLIKAIVVHAEQTDRDAYFIYDYITKTSRVLRIRVC